MEFSPEASYGMTQTELNALMAKDSMTMTKEEKKIWTEEVLRGVQETMRRSK